jgi:hypothetical protein
MKGLFAFVALVCLVGGISTYAQTAPGKSMTAIGTVKSVATDSIVVTDKDGKDWTFVVDKDTKAFAKGGSHMSDEKKANAETMTIVDSVKVGDKVNVKYHEMGEKKHAASVRVL